MTTDTSSTERLLIKSDDNDVIVCADILSGTDDIEYSEEWLMQQLNQQGFSGLSVIPEAHKKIAELIKNNTPGRVKLGQKIDAEAKVIVSQDLLSAVLRITAAKGGKAIETKAIVSALENKKIDLDQVDKQRVVKLIRESLLIEPGQAIEGVIAQGNPPQHGKNTVFEYLPDHVIDRKPHERADGTLDYYDLGELVCLDEGTALMRKHPPVMGINGLSVTGLELPARVANTFAFAKCKGAEVSSDDPDVLVSTIKGLPVIIDRGVNIENLYTVQNVGLESGHIEYDGSVIVKGDVASDMKIKVSGDVQIFGMVENASIEAIGNIDIKLGAVGHAVDHKAENKMQIRCKGNLTAAYLENAFVDVQGDILIKSRISNCEVIVGNRQQHKSGIVGGSVTAGLLVRAEVLGSSGGALTQVAIACDSDSLEKLDELKKVIVEHDERLVKNLGLMVSLSKKHTEEAKLSLQKLKPETEELKATINELIKQKGEIEAAIEQSGSGKIIVQKEVYPGVTLKILDQEQIIQSGYGPGSFLRINGLMSHTSSI